MLMISEDAWKEICILIPEKKSKVGRRPADPEIVFSGILFVLLSGTPWKLLPDYYGPKSTVHGHFMAWTRNGLFAKLLEKSIAIAIRRHGEPEAFMNDTAFSKAPFARFGGKNPTDRRKNGVKRGMVIDINRIILSIIVDAANRNDSKLLIPHLPALRKYVGSRPKVMSTDSAWDVNKLRSDLAKENIALHASTNVRRNKNRPKVKSGGRWRIEQVFGCLQWNRSVKTCWSKIKESYLALCQLAATIHNFKLVGIQTGVFG